MLFFFCGIFVGGFVIRLFAFTVLGLGCGAGRLVGDPLLFSLQSGDSVKPPLFRCGFALLIFCDSSVHYIIKVGKQLPAGYITFPGP